MEEDAEDASINSNIKDDVNTPDKKEFRINAQTFSVTYPKCPLAKELIMEFFTKKLPWMVEHIAVAHELHQDGSSHRHVYVRFQTKINLKSEKRFDIHGYHPNIQGTRNPQQWWEYTTKDGDYIQDFGWNAFSCANFIKRKADFEAFCMYQYKKRLDRTPIKELDFNGMKLKIEGKKKHYLIMAPADFGKTSWVEKTFAGKAVYKVSGSKYPFDNYDGEPTIILDDCDLDWKYLKQATNIYQTLTPVCGDTRYGVKYWPVGQERLIIILCNKEDCPYDVNQECFKARFNVVDLYNKPL